MSAGGERGDDCERAQSELSSRSGTLESCTRKFAGCLVGLLVNHEVVKGVAIPSSIVDIRRGLTYQ